MEQRSRQEFEWLNIGSATLNVLARFAPYLAGDGIPVPCGISWVVWLDNNVVQHLEGLMSPFQVSAALGDGRQVMGRAKPEIWNVDGREREMLRGVGELEWKEGGGILGAEGNGAKTYHQFTVGRS